MKPKYFVGLNYSLALCKASSYFSKAINSADTYTEQNFKCSTFVHLSRVELKDLKPFLQTQNNHFSQILRANVSKSVI